MQNFEDLESWKLSRQLRNDIAITVKRFPSEEKYRLTDQLIRASRSVQLILLRDGRFPIRRTFNFVATQKDHSMKF
ncbi:MAG TPA: four helix bundle protein [Bacteroidia bacterium]